MTPWTVAHQAPLSVEFSRQEYWSELTFPSPGDLPDPGIKPGSPALHESKHHTWSSYNYPRSCWRTQYRLLYRHLAFEANWKSEKVWWVSASLTDSKSKKSSFWSYCLMPLNKNEPFLNWIVMGDEGWIFYKNWRWPAQWLDWEEATNHCPKLNLHQKKRSWSLMVGCCLSDPL